MLKINENNKIDSRDIYEFVEVRTYYYDWLHRCIDYADLQEGTDFNSKLSKSTGGRPKKVYEFTIDAAKEMCIVSATPRAKELRRWLIGLSEQRESLELVTAKEAAFAFKVINALKYIDNQKEAYAMHRDSYVEKEGVNKYVYSDFAKYRAKIIGWDRQSVDKALHDYLMNHAGHNKNKLYKKSMSEKLSVMDISEAIRVAVLDILFSKGSENEIAVKFANFVKEVSKELDVQPLSKNETNLFQIQEHADINKLLTKTKHHEKTN
jgi:phage anti-repressor protein